MVKIERPGSTGNTKQIADLVMVLLASAPILHIAHLCVSGTGSYAAHKALNEYYDGIVGLADAIAEQYQGIVEAPLPYSETTIKIIKTVPEAISLLKKIYTQVNMVHTTCPYSEICNQLDEVKSLINSTKYKLVLLK